MSRHIKVLFAVLAVLIIMGSAYAFADANTIDASNSGYAASEISGYDISNVVYDLDALNPTLVDAIKFDVAPISGTVVAATVKIQTAAAGTWTDCTLGEAAGSSVPVTCTYESLELADISALNVVASSSADPGL